MSPAQPGAAALWNDWISGRDPEARKALILHYLYLVKYTIGRMTGSLSPRAEHADLLHAGVLGLIDAVEKFEAGRSIKFETYAAIRIQGAALDHLRSLDWMPRTLRRRARQLDSASEQLERTLGRPPSRDELAASLQVTPDQLRRWQQEAAEVNVLSLEEGYSSLDPSESSLRDSIEDAGEGPEGCLLESAVTESLADAISTLPPREQLVLALHYFEELTLKEVGVILELSEARISQLHAYCLNHLRRELAPYVAAR